MALLELLARKDDPAMAADQLGLPLFVLFRYRDAEPAFAAELLAAANYALDQVKSRVLSALLSDTLRQPTKWASWYARRPCDRA